jgi:hypothetical protein
MDGSPCTYTYTPISDGADTLTPTEAFITMAHAPVSDEANYQAIADT